MQNKRFQKNWFLEKKIFLAPLFYQICDASKSSFTHHMKTRYDAYLLEWNIPHEITLFIKSDYNESVLNILFENSVCNQILISWMLYRM